MLVYPCLVFTIQCNIALNTQLLLHTRNDKLGQFAIDCMEDTITNILAYFFYFFYIHVFYYNYYNDRKLYLLMYCIHFYKLHMLTSSYLYHVEQCPNLYQSNINILYLC